MCQWELRHSHPRLRSTNWNWGAPIQTEGIAECPLLRRSANVGRLNCGGIHTSVNEDWDWVVGIEEQQSQQTCTAVGAGVYCGLLMCDWLVQWHLEYNLSQGMRTMYHNVHLVNTSPWPCFHWHIQTAYNGLLWLQGLLSADQEVCNSGRLMAGARSYWWWGKTDGQLDQALPFMWAIISEHQRAGGKIQLQIGSP